MDTDDAAEGAGDRTLAPYLRRIAAVIAVVYALFHVYTAGFGNLPSLM